MGYNTIITDDYEYPLTRAYMVDMSKRYVRMLFSVLRRPDEQNLSFDQLARWYDVPNHRLGKGRLQRAKIKLVVLWNVISAASVCLVVARRVRIPIRWALKMDILASDLWVDELTNRHLLHAEKVEEFMCREDILSIPIVVSDDEGTLFIQDGNHRHGARKKRGFRKIRGILL